MSIFQDSFVASEGNAFSSSSSSSAAVNHHAELPLPRQATSPPATLKGKGNRQQGRRRVARKDGASASRAAAQLEEAALEESTLLEGDSSVMNLTGVGSRCSKRKNHLQKMVSKAPEEDVRYVANIHKTARAPCAVALMLYLHIDHGCRHCKFLRLFVFFFSLSLSLSLSLIYILLLLLLLV